MIATLGHAAVLVGLAATLFAAATFALGARRRDVALVAAARRGLLVAGLMAAIACVLLMAALLTHDFSLRYVVRNNATTTPPFYSVISLWAALEGSILFWTALAAGWANLVVHRYRDRYPDLMPWVGLALSIGLAFFFSVMAWPGDPFVRTSPLAAEGSGPNALLQNHPFMGLHPPLLYLGYTGMAIPFAFGVAALVTRRTDEEWLGIVRRWTLVPWIFLTAGIVAGAWWSYEVLGWGGYWAWDPVENAALLPWLTATAFLHSSMVAERRGSLRTWAHALVIATFALTLLGTFLTRSGVVASVHSFTQSAIGAWFAAGVLATLGVSLGLLVWRLPDLADRSAPGAVVSRESAFLFNNVLFLGVTFAVLFGTFYPLVVEAASGARVSVGAPWFTQVTGPMLIALLFLMGIGPALPWGGSAPRTLLARFSIPVLGGVGAVVVCWALGVRDPVALAVIGLASVVLLVAGDELWRGARARQRSHAESVPQAAWRLAARNRRRYGGYLIHVGVCVMAIAIAISAGGGEAASVVLSPGESTRIGAYTVDYHSLQRAALRDDARVVETRAELTLSGPQSGALAPALRDYPNSLTPVATPVVRTSLAEDLYVTLQAYDLATQAITLRLLVNPLVVWIWLGGAVVALGAVFAAWPDRRLRRAVQVGSSR